MGVPFFQAGSEENLTVYLIQETAPPNPYGKTNYNFYPASHYKTAQIDQLGVSGPFDQSWSLWGNRWVYGDNAGNLYSSRFADVIDAVCSPQNVASAGNLTINGRFASAGAVNFAAGAQTVTAISSATETRSLTITGTDANGNPLTGTVIPGSLTTPNETVAVFKTVTGVSAPAKMNGLIRLGGTLNQRTFFSSISKAVNSTFSELTYGLGYDSSVWQGYLTIANAAVTLPGTTTLTALTPDPLTATLNSNVIDVYQPGHNLVSGQQVVLTNVVSFAGIPLGNLPGPTVDDADVDANNWSFLINDLPTSTATGGGSNVTVVNPAPAGTVLGARPMASTNGSATVTVTQPGHSWLTGETVDIEGCGSGGGKLASNFNGSRVVTVVDANTWTYQASAACTTVDTFGSSSAVTPASALVATNTSRLLTVRHGNNGCSAGDTAVLAGFTGFAGLASGNINATFAVVSATQNSLVVQMANPATSTAAGGGTGTATYTYRMTAIYNVDLLATQVTAVSVDGATTGNITVGGLYDGAAVICASQKPSGAGNLSLVGGGPVTLSQLQDITITSSANDTARTFTLHLLNRWGVSATYSLTGPNAATETVVYNAMIPSITNSTMPFLDKVPLPDAIMPAGLWGVFVDYEVADTRTSATTLSFMQTFASLCHNSPLGRFNAAIRADALNARTAGQTGFTPQNLPLIREAVDYTCVLLNTGNVNGSIPESYSAQMTLLAGSPLGADSVEIGEKAMITCSLSPTLMTVVDVATVRALSNDGPVKRLVIWRDLAVSGSPNPYDDYNLKTSALAFGYGVPNALIF